MIIDFHTHVFADGFASRALDTILKNIKNFYHPYTGATVSELCTQMDRSGIDLSVIQPVVTKLSQVEPLNTWAASLCSDRIIAFGGIYPQASNYKEQIDFVVSLGLKGLKFHCEYQDFVVDAPEMLPVYDYALSRGLILLHHAGFDPAYPPPYRSSPQRFAAVGEAMRGGVIVAAHLGGHDQWDDVERYLVGTDIYLDTAMGLEYYSREQFLRIVHAHGADKILFASDSPWSDPAPELQRFRELPLTPEELSLILGGNAARLLKV